MSLKKGNSASAVAHKYLAKTYNLKETYENRF